MSLGNKVWSWLMDKIPLRLCENKDNSIPFNLIPLLECLPTAKSLCQVNTNKYNNSNNNKKATNPSLSLSGSY
jgi:hypothetical protein